MAKDYYKILGISRDATSAQIKSAYRKLARKCHPDVNKSDDAEARFTEATEAYEVLSDPQKRQMYDQFGHVRPGPGQAQTWSSSGQGAPTGFEDFFGARSKRSGFMGMSLDDLLDALGGRRSKRRQRPAARGADTESPIVLEFLQAVRGTTVTLETRRPQHNGQLKTETLNVKIPPGVKDGSRIRVKGKGVDGPAGPGDLYIVTHVRRHPYFRRQGNDIYVDLPISITEAALGAKVDVPTVDGVMTVTIPPGTPSARKLRLKGKGIGKADGQRGDQYVRIQIVPPPKLTERAGELLAELQAADPYDPREAVPWKDLG